MCFVLCCVECCASCLSAVRCHNDIRFKIPLAPGESVLGLPWWCAVSQCDRLLEAFSEPIQRCVTAVVEQGAHAVNKTQSAGEAHIRPTALHINPTEANCALSWTIFRGADGSEMRLRAV